MTKGHVLDPRSLARIAGGAGAVTAMIATVVAISVAAQARHWLGFSFGGVPPRIGEAVTILLNNGRFVVGIMAAAWLEQLRWRKTSTANRSGASGVLSAMVVGVEVVVLFAVLFNAALVGLALGAYGWRMVPALLPHGPFEVVAYCVAANLFLNARRRSISGQEWLAAAGASVMLLILAAVLETFAWFG